MSNKIIKSSLLMRNHVILKNNRDEITGGKLQIMLQSFLFTTKDIQVLVHYQTFHYIEKRLFG